MLKKLAYFLFCISALGCSQFSKSPTSKAWHNMNAKFNASIDAKDYYDWALQKIDSAQIEDYSVILPILHRIDSNQTAVSKLELEEVIRLSSLIAERHSNSKHLDGSYILLGKARLYREDIINATEVFKYVNANNSSEDAKHEALIWLMRSYMEFNDINKANEVAKLISSFSLSKKNKATFYEIKAAHHQRIGEPALAAVYLEEALKFMPKNTHKARAYFIAGQLYQSLQRGSLARENWRKVIKNRPTYELEFNSGIELLMLGNSLGANANANFAKMLEDRKNIDLKDKIYFKMAQAKALQGNYRAAIKDFSQSVALAENKTQKASAYLRIADIYHSELQDYEKASKYYDSTLLNMNERSPNFKEISEKAASLSDFVKFQHVLKMEDSLQVLATMSQEALEIKIDEMLAEEAVQEKIASEKAKALADIEKNKTLSENTGSSRSDKWFFYNQTALSRSRADFIRTWGTRTLEDHWRRKNKEMGSISFASERGIVDEENSSLSEEEALAIKEEAAKLAQLESKKQAMLKAVPNTPQKLAGSKRRQEEAYYQLGKIYKLQFDEDTNSRNTFLTLLEKFPETKHEQEVLYFLSLMEKDKLNNLYKERLLTKFPFSSYSRQLKRGSKEMDADTEGNAERDYAILYKEFKSENVSEALVKAEKGLFDYTGTSLEDKYAMLRIMLLAKTKNMVSYRIALMDFMQSYPSSNLAPQVSKMLTSLSKAN